MTPRNTSHEGAMRQLLLMSSVVGRHHDGQFGSKPLGERALKLAEEAGEVAGAVIRHLERRDGHGWLPEVTAELGDVLIVWLGVVDLLLSTTELTSEQRNEIATSLVRTPGNFLAREWQIGRKAQ